MTENIQRVLMVGALDNLRGGTKRVYVVNGGQIADMPTAGADYAGNIVQYVGETGGGFVQGYFYICTATTIASSASASQTVGSGLTDIAVDVDTLESFTGWTSDNSLQIFYTTDGWSVDPTSLGITFTGTPVDGDAITVVYTAATTTYSWNQIDVQPGGADAHNLGWYANPTALQTAYPTATNGDFAIVGSTDTVWVWDADTTAWVDTDTKGQVTSVNGTTGDVVITPAGIGAATTSLNNLTGAGKNISNWSTNVSNCVIEIPQDIKLELSAGTLTLKSGSKITWPDGTTYTTTVDRSFTNSNNGTKFLYLQTTGYVYIGQPANNTTSGTTDSLAGSAYHTWFDTTNNYIYAYGADGTTPVYNTSLSLPIAVITISDGAISSIDPVFNGFGYIGSTEFALPGVTVLVPNGRKSDGSLNNISTKLQTVQILTISGNSPIHIAIRDNGTLGWWNTSETKYNEAENLNYYNNARQYYAVVGKFDVVSNQITNFEPHTAFHAVDYNDIESLSVNALSSITGYDATKTQTLKNVQGTLTWVDDA